MIRFTLIKRIKRAGFFSYCTVIQQLTVISTYCKESKRGHYSTSVLSLKNSSTTFVFSFQYVIFSISKGYHQYFLSPGNQLCEYIIKLSVREMMNDGPLPHHIFHYNMGIKIQPNYLLVVQALKITNW